MMTDALFLVLDCLLIVGLMVTGAALFAVFTFAFKYGPDLGRFLFFLYRRGRP